MNERVNGGLIALTVDEAQTLLNWGYTMNANGGGWDDDDLDLYGRLEEWKRRHTPEDAS